MVNNIKIRKLEASDAEQYVKLHNLVWQHTYKDIFPNKVFEERESRTQARINGFADWLNDNPQQIGYVAEVDGVMVGFMNATIISNYEHFKECGYAELMGLYIHPDYQRMGIGSTFKKIFTIYW